MESRRGQRAPFQNRSNDEVLAGLIDHGRNIEHRMLPQWQSLADKQRDRADDTAVAPDAPGGTAVGRQRPWSCGACPPIACNLVAFEPGSLGLELEAIVDESTSAITTKRKGRERLGCRVFRVTPSGQAAKHGNIHPGDALVVLDGIQILSKPFDVITQELLERRDRRRLIGFIGTAAVAAPPTGAVVNGVHTQARGHHGNSSQRNGRRYVSASSLARKPDERRRDDRVVGDGKREVGVGANAAGDNPDEMSSATRQLRQPSASASTLVRDYFLGNGATRSSGWEGGPLSSSQAPHAGEPSVVWNGRGVSDKLSVGTTFEGLSSESKGTSAMGCSGGNLGSVAAEGVGVLKEHSIRQHKRSTLSLENSREEPLQKTLEKVMEEKRAMVVEREWLLEEVQRAREVALEREGELAGQEVKTDVLKMEVKALEIELRRARQKIGSCDAVRRELEIATKRDLARRDHEITRLSSLLVAADHRAADAEKRALEEAKKRETDAAAALRREREGREIEVRERREEVAALKRRVDASEGHARILEEENEIQIRGMEGAMVKSLGDAEQRRSELEKYASKMAARLKERLSEAKRLEKRTKELEGRLETVQARNAELHNQEAVEVQRLRRALERARVELEDRARVEEDLLSQRLREQELKGTVIATHLREAEQRAKVLETGAIVARRRAELGTQKENEALQKLAKAERACACQEVSITALKAQLEQQRESTVAGDAATRENTKVKAVLQELLKRSQFPVGEEDITDEYDGRGLVELAKAVGRWVGEREHELEDVRDALEATRREKEALLEREGDAVELRSLLEEKRGVSAELVAVANSARARTEHAEGEVEKLRAEASSLRETIEKGERRAAQHEKAVEALGVRIGELEGSLEAARKESEALDVKAAEAGRAMVEARAELARAKNMVSPLEERLGEVIRRFTLKDAECVAVKARLEGFVAELETAKAALYQGSDERVSSRNKACVIIASVLARGQVRKTVQIIALLRWRRATVLSASPDSSTVIGGNVSSEGLGGDKEEALPRSELSSVYPRNFMSECGVQVLAEVISKWATRQRAAAFWHLAMTCNMGDSLNDTTGDANNSSASWSTGDNDVIDNDSKSDTSWGMKIAPRIANVGQQQEDTLEKKSDRGMGDGKDKESDNDHRLSSTSRSWWRRREGVEDYDDEYLSSATTVSPSAVVKDLVLPVSPADSNTTVAAVDVNSSNSNSSSNSRSGSGQRRHDANREVFGSENGHGQRFPLGSSWGGDSGVAPFEADFETDAKWVSGGLEPSLLSSVSSEPRYHCLPGFNINSRSRSASPGAMSNNGRGVKGAIAAFDVSDGESAEHGDFLLDTRRQQQEHQIQQEKGGNGGSQSGGMCFGGESGTGSRDNVHKIEQQQQQHQQIESGCEGGLSLEGDAGMVIGALKIPTASVEGDDSAWWAYSDDSGS